ncbi:hypothetical protein ABEB36_001001 [Hypothenemus hampei]|uniref:Anamorsin homolog n=1 Tax=Hypothenemus hampei TaxID=57062 RepID=A0ABD1FD75_HYPHA
MDVFNNLNDSQSLLVICSEADTENYQKATSTFSCVKFATLETVSDLQENSFDNAVVSVESALITPQTVTRLLKVLKSEGKLIITTVADSDTILFNLKTNGFMNVTLQGSSITAFKPKFAVGSSAKLNLKKPTVWKLDDEDDDVIDQDDLLDEDDLKKPDPSSLRVCGTTGKRKACKDCSCGLAQELASEAQKGKVVDTTDAPKSSCGSCYLGDAFRCASCPYLGMPAFKPGEKIQLPTNLLKNDL